MRFQSTLPAGEATKQHPDIIAIVLFQSTLPAGEATQAVAVSYFTVPISIHASRGGSDNVPAARLPLRKPFQSTLPAGEATRLRLCGGIGT